MASLSAPPCQDSWIEAEPCPEAAGRAPAEAVKRIALGAAILASSMAFIDGSALTVALPALRDDLGGDVGAVQWVLNGYMLALAALTMVGGALADAYGRARMLRLGCAAFALASIACALAPGAGSLVAARVLQGVAAALVTPASLALIGETFPKTERSRAIGAWAAASALTTAGGPVLGGWLTETFSWRAVFWINAPIAALAIALLSRLPAGAPTKKGRFDVAGAALLAAALAFLALALTQVGGGGEAGEVARADFAGAFGPGF